MSSAEPPVGVGAPPSLATEFDLAEVLAGLWSTDGTRDPHPYFHQLRAHVPIVELPSPNSWMLTRHADCTAVLQDSRWWSLGDVYLEQSKAELAADDAMPDRLELLRLVQPVDSQRVRAVVNRYFSTAALKAQRARVSELVDDLLEPIAARGSAELLTELASPLPLTVMCELLGLPASDHDRFAEWSYEAAKLLHGELSDADRSACLSAAFELVNYLNPLIEARRHEPGADLLSALATSTGESGLTETELRSLSVLLLVASHETTSNLIVNGINTLLEHPDELQRLRDDPSLINTAVEEILRFDGSVQAAPRFASEPLEVAERSFPAGSQLVVSLIAANRDPAVFDEPDRFDIARRPNPHIALGKGAHHCLGAALARLIAQECILGLVTRFEHVQRTTERAEHRTNLVIRGLAELRVELA